jgi:DNA-binding transcriptional ArsR family regulator
MPSEVPDTVELTDPRALRALAHPTRLKLVTLLRRRGPMTASRAGELIGESPASCSFHLRQLARWRLVEEAGGGRGRERPWRATARSTAWKVSGPEAAEPSAALSALVAQYQMGALLRALEALPGEPEPWQRAHQLTDTVLELTPEQLEELGARVLELIRSYGGPQAEAERDSARRVGIIFAGFPLPEGEP